MELQLDLYQELLQRLLCRPHTGYQVIITMEGRLLCQEKELAMVEMYHQLPRCLEKLLMRK